MTGDRREADPAFVMALRELKRLQEAAEEVFPAQGKARRSPQFSDIPERYKRACNALHERGARQTKQALATEMGIDRKTLARYIVDLDLPFPPQ